MFAAYVVTLMAAVALAGVVGQLRQEPALIFAGGALLYNWVLNQLAVAVTDSYSPWLAFLATDGVCLALLLGLAAGARGCARIGCYALAATYFAQMAMNFHFGLSDRDAAAEWRHWRAITLVAFGQLAIVVAWTAVCLERKRA